MTRGTYFEGTAKKCTLIRRKQTEAQESRIEHFKRKGKQQFTEDGSSTEITIDLVLQARTKLSDNKVNGPEDAIQRDDQKDAHGKEPHCCEVLSGTISWSDGISKFVEDREFFF